MNVADSVGVGTVSDMTNDQSEEDGRVLSPSGALPAGAGFAAGAAAFDAGTAPLAARGRTQFFKNPWWIVLGCFLSMSVSAGPIMQFTFGVFLTPLTLAFAASRGVISLALTAALCLTAIGTPVAGWLFDRYGMRAICLPSIIVFALIVASLGVVPKTSAQFIAVYALLGIVAAAQTPLPYVKAISLAFDKRRGLALGVAVAGVGFGVTLMPFIAQRLIGAFGWRGAYMGLGAITFCVAFPAVLIFVRGTGGARMGGVSRTAQLAGLSSAEALRAKPFWILAAAVFLVTLACAGVFAHVIAIMADRGVPARQAVEAISFAGIAMIAGRVVSGWLLDNFFAPHVAAAFFLFPIAGIVLIAFAHGLELTLLGAMGVGVGLGAEVDMIAFLAARYIGLRAYGVVYGYLLFIFMVGSALGPLLMGVCFARTGSYWIGLGGLEFGLVLAIVLITQLGPIRFELISARNGAEQSTARRGDF